jgi:hypothetical protein
MARTIELNLIYTLLLAVLVYFAGQALASRVALLKRFSIPAPVVGGCLVAVALALADGFLHTRVAFADSYRLRRQPRRGWWTCNTLPDGRASGTARSTVRSPPARHWSAITRSAPDPPPMAERKTSITVAGSTGPTAGCTRSRSRLRPFPSSSSTI